MRLSNENIVILLESLAENPVIKTAAAKINVTPMTVWRWLRLSREGSEEFQHIEWGEEIRPFHEFYEYAMRAQIERIEQHAKKNAMAFEEVVTHQGAVSYVVDPKLVGESDDPDILEMLWGVRDKYLRNERGEVIPLTVARKPSDALVIKMLSSHKPEIYGEHSTVHLNVGGVLTLARPDEPLVVEAKAITLDGAGSKQLDRPMLALGRPSKDVDELKTWADSGEFEHTPVLIENEKGEQSVMSAAVIAPHDDPDNPITRDTRAREAARDARIAAEPKKPPAMAPVPPEMKPSLDDDIDDVTGKPMKTVPPSAHTVEVLIASIEQSVARGTHLGPHERQIAGRLKAGDMAGAVALAQAMIGPSRMAKQDHLGAGPAKPPGTRVV